MNFIVIEGNIGAGKTSLVNKIGNRLNSRVILEQFSDNPFLPGFYKDPEKYTLPLELSFLAGRYNQLKNERTDPGLFETFTIADYYFAKSLIFSNTTLSGHEYKLFRQIFDIMNTSIPRPDIYVYLHVEIDKLLHNIKKRGRLYEQSITQEYLKKIQKSYFEYMKQSTGIRFLIIDTGKTDFVSSEEDFEKMVDIIINGNFPLGINRTVL